MKITYQFDSQKEFEEWMTYIVYGQITPELYGRMLEDARKEAPAPEPEMQTVTVMDPQPEPAPEPVKPVEEPVEEPKAEPEYVYTLDDLSTVMTDLLDVSKEMQDKLIETIQSFGVNSLQELGAEHYPAMAEKLKALGGKFNG